LEGDFSGLNSGDLSGLDAVAMDGLKYSKLALMGLILATVAGCGGIGPLTQGMPEFVDAIPEFEPSYKSKGKVEQFDGDLWSARQDWTVWQGAKGIEGGGDPELVSRWRHPATKLIREEIARTKGPRSVGVRSAGSETSPDVETTPIPSTGALFHWSDLLKRNDLDGWNGIILYARYHPAEAAEYLPQLIDMVEEPREYSITEKNEAGEKSSKTMQTSKNFRASAAEGCGFVLQGGGGTSPQRDLERVIELAERTDLPDEVRIELFRGLGRVLPPRDIPQLSHALRPQSTYSTDDPVPSQEVRLAAVDACLYHAVVQQTTPDRVQGDWPPNLLNLRNDPDYRLRIKIGQLAAVTRHAAAPQLLKEQLVDGEAAVRLEALVSLGRLGTAEAREELQIQGKKNEELMRVSAIRGLAFYGPEELRAFSGDSSPLVRQELAAQLASFQDYESAIQLRKLLVDQNPQVQLEVVKGVVHWPDRPAVSLLIYALQESSSKTRQSALSGLETRFGAPLLFPVHGTREERLREAEKLARSWPGGIDLDLNLRVGAKNETSETEQLRIADLLQDLRSLAVLEPEDPRGASIQRRLMNLRPSDVNWLEQYLNEAPPNQKQWLLNDVLPKLNRMHQALADMERPDVLTRRRGAEHLVMEANSRPLGGLELSRLEQILAREQDAIVWRFAMTALEKDVSLQGVRIAQMAVNHTWPDIRILGCQQIGQQGGQEQALWLLPLLGDSNVQVQAAAVDAAMRCGNPIILDGVPGQGSGGVRSLLTTNHPPLRVKVCACLCRFGDQQGVNELLRLARDGDWNIRYQAIEAMGMSGQTRFVESLVQLGWTEKQPSVQRVLLQSLEQLVPPSQRPGELQGNLTTDRQLEAWVGWWNRRQAVMGVQTVEGNP